MTAGEVIQLILAGIGSLILLFISDMKSSLNTLNQNFIQHLNEKH